MKTPIVITAIILLCSCANGSNENKGTETPTVSPTENANDSAHADTMVQPNGVTNGTVTVDSTKH